jgi:hypothetical protein
MPDDRYPIKIFLTVIIYPGDSFHPPKPFQWWHYIIKITLNPMVTLFAHLDGKSNSV